MQLTTLIASKNLYLLFLQKDCNYLYSTLKTLTQDKRPLMKLNTYILGLFLILNCALIKAQEEIHNFGNLQLHETAMVGFHSDFTNDGGFDQNLGLAGFYQEDRSITISGAFAPIFYDAEIAVDHGLILETSIGATNNVNLISGDIITPRNNTFTFANFLDNAFYTGENHVSLVDGYATITNKRNIYFSNRD